MKKCSIALLFLFQMAGSAMANASGKTCSFLPDAPDRHTVVRTDTLWGISGKFLVHPWCWPRVWEMNHEHIKNPHWIYPGQVIVLDRQAGRLHIAHKIAGTGVDPHKENRAGAIATLNMRAIGPFLSRAIVIDKEAMATAPQVLAGQDQRLNMGTGDRIYVSGDLVGQTAWQIYRPARPMLNPDDGAILGYEAQYVGQARVLQESRQEGVAHSMVIESAEMEVVQGDRLVVAAHMQSMHYAPHAPDKEVSARIISTYDGEVSVAQYQIVAFNKGLADNISPGMVLGIYREGRMVKPPDAKQTMRLPDAQLATLLVFRVFNNVSYGLIMDATEPVQVLDRLSAPQAALARE